MIVVILLKADAMKQCALHLSFVNNMLPKLVHLSSALGIGNHMTGDPAEVLNNCKHVELNCNVFELDELQSINDSFEGQSPHFWEVPTENSVADCDEFEHSVENLLVRRGILSLDNADLVL